MVPWAHPGRIYACSTAKMRPNNISQGGSTVHTHTHTVLCDTLVRGAEYKSSYLLTYTTHKKEKGRFMALFRDHPGEPVPEENF